MGSITGDHVETPDLVLDGELGGSAAYFALAARHFGPVAVIGAVGADREAELRRTLAFADLSRLSVTATPTARWRARRRRRDAEAETLERFEGATRGWRPDVAGSEIWPRAIFLGSLHPAAQLAVATAAPEGSLIGGDTMDVFIRDRRALLHRVLQRLRFLLLTETELRLLTGMRGLSVAASRMLADHPLQAVIAKRGAQGVVLFTRGREDRLRAFPVTVVDPTGAGDALAGAFMGRLAQTGDLSPGGLLEALEHGVVAASFAIAAPGLAGLLRLTGAELEARLVDYRAYQGLL